MSGYLKKLLVFKYKTLGILFLCEDQDISDFDICISVPLING